MQPSAASELTESTTQFLHAWRAMTAAYEGVRHGALPGLDVVWADVPLFFYNVLFLSGPVADAADLQARTARVIEYMAGERQPGMFVVCEELLPAGLNGDEALAASGFVPAVVMSGMAAQELLPPTRPLQVLEYRRVGGEQQTLVDLYDLNAQAYGLPVEMCRGSMGPLSGWGENAFGYVGYLEDRAVTSAATLIVDGRLYVALVATLKEAQRRGYAEAVIRHSLAEASRANGLTRTVLHASEEGFPVYVRMGYHTTGKFTAYVRLQPSQTLE